MKNSSRYIILSAIILGAIAVRLVPIAANLPYMYWHDENNYIESAMRFGSGNLNPMSLFHGGLYQLLLFLSYGAYFIFQMVACHIHSKMDFYLSYIKDPSSFFLIARGMSVFCSIGITYLTYAIASRIYNKNAGLSAAIFSAFSLIMIQISFLALADMTAIFILMLSFLILVHSIGRPEDRILFYVSSLLVGLAVACKYHVVFGVASLYVAAFIKSAASPNRWRKCFELSAIGSVIVLAGFLIGMPYLVLRYKDFYNEAFVNMGRQYILNNPDKNTWLFYFTHHLKNGLGIYLEVLAVLGVAYALLKRSRWDLLLLSFPVAYYLVFMNSVGFAYHMLPALPFLFILAAGLLDGLTSKMFKKLSGVALISLSVLIVSPSFGDALRYVKVITSRDTRIEAKGWIEANIARDSRILAEGYLSAVPVHTPPIGDNMNTLERDLADTLHAGGSGFYVKTKIANAGLLYGNIISYDIVKADSLSKVDVDSVKPDYIIMTSTNDKMLGEELSYFSLALPKDYFEKRNELKDYVSKNYELIKSFQPTYEFTLWFPHLVDHDYNVIRKISLNSRDGYVKGPRIDIFKTKEGSSVTR